MTASRPVGIAADPAAVRAALKRMITESAGIPEEVVDDDSSFDGTLAMDSLSLTALQVAIEAKFHVDCSLDDVRAAGTFGELADLVLARLAR